MLYEVITKRILELLRKRIMLWHVDPSKPFYLFVDASDTASGSVLMQYKGCPMKAGDKVLMSFPSANRDPEMFENPDFALHMMRKLAHRVRALSGSVRDLALLDVSYNFV